MAIETRGMRNNNPGNIRHGSNWQGLREEQTDKSFCQFKSMEYGVRALCKVLLTYYNKYKLNTVKQIISRWAPASDGNNTAAYIRFVSSQLMVSPESRINLRDYGTMKTIAHAIIVQENGYGLTESVIDKGVKMALGNEVG